MGRFPIVCPPLLFGESEKFFPQLEHLQRWYRPLVVLPFLMYFVDLQLGQYIVRMKIATSRKGCGSLCAGCGSNLILNSEFNQDS